MAFLAADCSTFCVPGWASSVVAVPSVRCYLRFVDTGGSGDEESVKAITEARVSRLSGIWGGPPATRKFRGRSARAGETSGSPTIPPERMDDLDGYD